MRQQVQQILDELIVCYPQLGVCKDDIEKALILLKQCYENDGKVLVCGNGGSAADSEHIVGELMKSFRIKRRISSPNAEKLKLAFPEDGVYLSENLEEALPAISLTGHPSLTYAFMNDVAAEMLFAQQVYGQGRPEDVLIGLSTSGNAANVINAVKVANVFGLKTIGFTGENGGKLSCLCNASIRVPASETYKIQELHLPVYHALCAMIEVEFFGYPEE